MWDSSTRSSVKPWSSNISKSVTFWINGVKYSLVFHLKIVSYQLNQVESGQFWLFLLCLPASFHFLSGFLFFMAAIFFNQAKCLSKLIAQIHQFSTECPLTHWTCVPVQATTSWQSLSASVANSILRFLCHFKVILDKRKKVVNGAIFLLPRVCSSCLKPRNMCNANGWSTPVEHMRSSSATATNQYTFKCFPDVSNKCLT